MTYSIVARDASTGQLGVASQSSYFALGRVVPWARAGIGAVATQAMVDPGYGPRLLDLLATGTPVQTALEQVRGQDPNHEVRQVGVVDAAGNVAGFSGALCIDHVSHARGDGYTAQANMVRGPDICEAMAEAFEQTDGALSHRLMAALLAAEDAGGDARGVMSAAMLIVEGERHDHPWEGVVIDVRVDHDVDPLGELARLIRVAEAYHLCDVAEEALVQGDMAAALASAQAGLEILPGEANLLLSYIAALSWAGRLDEARQETLDLVESEPGWEGILRAIVNRGLVPLPEGFTFDQLMSDPEPNPDPDAS